MAFRKNNLISRLKKIKLITGKAEEKSAADEMKKGLPIPIPELLNSVKESNYNRGNYLRKKGRERRCCVCR